MPHNAEIDTVMNAIMMRLLPVSSKETHPELWHLHNALQEWELNLEWQYPHIGTDASANIAHVILLHLKDVSDRDLVRKIEHLIERANPQAAKQAVMQNGFH